MRYRELNPVRARLCIATRDWEWSSAAARLGGQGDGIVDVQPMLERIDNREPYLSSRETDITNEALRKHTRSGRSAGDDNFIAALDQQTKRRLQKLKPGPKPADKVNCQHN